MAKKATKAPKKYPWQIEAEQRRREIDEFVAMLRDGPDEYLVEITRQALDLYHDAMMRGDKAGRRDPKLLIEACVDTLYRIEEYRGQDQRPDGTSYSWPARGRSRFDCWNSASRWLGEQVAAKPGAIPKHGQPGRFVLMIHGCRTDVRYPGLFGGEGLDGRVIDLDRPFFSETGFRSFTGGLSGERWFTEDDAMTVDEMLTVVMEESLLADHNGKRMAECPLYKPPFGMSWHKGKETRRPSPQDMIESRKGDPAWKRGGFLANLPPITSGGAKYREERNGQLALLF